MGGKEDERDEERTERKNIMCVCVRQTERERERERERENDRKYK